MGTYIKNTSREMCGTSNTQPVYSLGMKIEMIRTEREAEVEAQVRKINAKCSQS
jgi:hypothetical protein